MRNLGITIAGITFVVLMIKIGTDPDNKAKYLKLTKHVLIATVLITLSLSIVEIPKFYFGSTVEITDGELSDMTIGKIEDKDCQGRETVKIDGKTYVVTDTNKRIAALTDSDSLKEPFGLYSLDKVVTNVSFLRPFNDCQGMFKGYFANIVYYRDSDGFIFPSYFTYSEYTACKGMGGNFTQNGRRRSVGGGGAGAR